MRSGWTRPAWPTFDAQRESRHLRGKGGIPLSTAPGAPSRPATPIPTSPDGPSPSPAAKVRADNLIGRIAGEAYLDAALRDAGVIVIHPEELPLADQLRLHRRAARRSCTGWRRRRGWCAGGIGFDVSRGLTVLDEVALLEVLGERFGIHLAPHWDSAAFRAAVLADLERWRGARRGLTARLGYPADDGLVVEQCLAELGFTAPT